MNIADKVVIVALLLIGDGGLIYLGVLKADADAKLLASYTTANKGVRD